MSLAHMHDLGGKFKRRARASRGVTGWRWCLMSEHFDCTRWRVERDAVHSSWISRSDTTCDAECVSV